MGPVARKGSEAMDESKKRREERMNPKHQDQQATPSGAQQSDASAVIAIQEAAQQAATGTELPLFYGIPEGGW